MYRTPWIRVRRDEVRNHNGKPLTYSVVDLHHPSVFIVAVNSRGEALLQQVYRYTTDKTFWEIPSSDNWTSLGRLYQAVGIGNIPLEVFLARDVRKDAEATDKAEEISQGQFVSIGKIEDMARRGELDDAPVLAALYLAKLHGL